MRMCVISALLFFPTPQAAPTVDAAFERLTKVGLFAFGGVGFAGNTSPGEKDYKVIHPKTRVLAIVLSTAECFLRGHIIQRQGFC